MAFWSRKSTTEVTTTQGLLDFLNIGTVDKTRLSEATYFACLKILGETMGKLPLKLLQQTEKGGVVKAYKHPLYNIAGTRPNPYMTAAQRWIPVGERLPDDVGSYLVYYHEWSNGDFLPKYDDYRIRVMRFVNNGKWRMPVCTDKRCEADTNREVTHWQPLPRPPQKG